MTTYDEAPPEIQAAADKMIAEINEGALDVAKVAAMEVGMPLTEDTLLHIRIGVESGMASTIGWLRQRGLLADT